MQYFLKEEIIKNILNEPIRSQLSTETKPLCHIIQHHHLLLPKLQILGTCHQKKLNLLLSKQANQEGKLAVFLSLRYTQSLWWKEEMLLCWIPSRTKWLNVLDGERKYSLEKEFWTTVFLKKFSSFILKVTSATKQLLKMCHLRQRLRIFLFHQKVMFLPWDIQVFLFLTIHWFTKYVMSWWVLILVVHQTVHFWIYLLNHNSLTDQTWSTDTRARAIFFWNRLNDLEDWGQVPGPF